MDINESPTTTAECQYKEDIASIKKCLVDLAADMCEVKNRIKKQTEIVDKCDELVQRWNTREEFENFNEEILAVSAKFDGFVEILKKLYTCNANIVKNDLSKYFKTVLNAVFGKQIVQTISWGRYSGKLSVKNSMVIDAIQRSGAIVDSMSTEYGRLKLLQKEFNKYKDAKRIRSSKQRKIISITSSKLQLNQNAFFTTIDHINEDLTKTFGSELFFSHIRSD